MTKAADADLVRNAAAVLDANWLGDATKPSPHLYPHQWSWDAAFIAIGNAHRDQSRAEQELRTLFGAQWSNGMLPHIVFADGAVDYFPGPDFWQVELSPDAPQRPTSGIVQPPIHATSAWHVYRHARDRERARSFLQDLFPGLVSWHEYLYRERSRDGDGLVEIWHPWESGMDNSPLWDAALERITPRPEEIPSYERSDLTWADESGRPSSSEYDRYAYLVKLFRDSRYSPAAIRQTCPFAIQPVLFNSLLVQASRDLAEIARTLGHPSGRYGAWADRTASAIESKLWDDELGLYLDHDVSTGLPIRTKSATGCAPLYAGVPSAERAQRLVEQLATSGMEVDGIGWAATSLPPTEPRFDPLLYWRGPVWPVVNWVLYRGLARYGYAGEAKALRSTMLELVRRGGFWEHFDPTSGRGQGGTQFAWTAALTLDLLFSGPAGDGSDDSQATMAGPAGSRAADTDEGGRTPCTGSDSYR